MVKAPWAARWCGYCERSLEGCVCPPWMPNTGTDEERKARGARQEVEAKAHSLYIASTANDATIHCNRFPAWSELTDAERREWRDRARSALDQAEK